MPYNRGLLVLLFFAFFNGSNAQKRISPDEAMDNVGLYVRVCEKVFDGVYLEKSTSKVTLLNMGAAYPDHKLTIVISKESRENFTQKPEEFYVGKYICVMGRVESRNGKPQIEIFTPPSIVDSASLETAGLGQGAIAVSMAPPKASTPARKKVSGWEAGLSFGTMQAATDIGRKESAINLSTENIKVQAGVYGSYSFHKRLAARFEINFGTIEASDANGKQSVQSRGLHFRSKIIEAAILGQVTPVTFKNGAFYLFGGFGVFSFDPQARYNGAWVKLQPLSTEGQGFAEFPGTSKYNRTQICLPFGGGLQFDLSSEIMLRLEANYRWTSTDYLDDASKLFIDRSLFFSNLPQQTAIMAAQLSNPNPSYNIPGAMIRGGQNSKDKYFSFSVKLGFKFKQ